MATYEKDGRYYKDTAFLPPEEITKEEYDQRQKSFGGAVAGEFADTLQDSAGGATEMVSGAAGGGGILGTVGGALSRAINPLGGALDLVGDTIGVDLNPMDDLGRAIAEQNDPRQAARRNANPNAQVIGRAGAIAVETLAPVPKGVGALGRGRVPRPKPPIQPGTASTSMVQSLRETGIGTGIETRARAVAGAAGDLPVIGPGAKAVGNTLNPNIGRMGQERRVNSINAAENTGERFHANLMDPDEYRDFMRVAEGAEVMPDAARANLMARNAEEASDMHAVLQQQIRQERANPGAVEALMQGERPNVSGQYATLRNDISSTILREGGMDPNQAVSREGVGSQLRNISAELSRLQGDRPVDIDGLNNLATDLLGDEAQNMASTRILSAEAERAAKQVKGWIDDLSDETGFLSQENAAVIQNRIGREIERKAPNQSDTEVVGILAEFQEELQDQIAATMSGETLARNQELRKQWGVIKPLVMRANAFGPEGVNLPTYMTGRQSKNYMEKTGRSGTEFARWLETSGHLLKMVPPSTGSGETVSLIGR